MIKITKLSPTQFESFLRFCQENLAYFELVLLIVVVILRIVQFFIKPRIQFTDFIKNSQHDWGQKIIIPPPNESEGDDLKEQ